MRRLLEIFLLAIIITFSVAISIKGIEMLGLNTINYFFEFLKILISWPLAVIVFVVFFNSDIRDFLKKVNRVGFGGMILEDKQALESTIRNQEKFEKEDSVPELDKEIEIHVESGPDGNAFDAKDIEIDELRKNLDFEKIYNAIFGSQIYLLKRLWGKNIQGEFRILIDSYFAEIQKQNKPILDDKTSDEYLGFLISTGLVETSDLRIYKITQRGIDFLGYILSEGYSEKEGTL